MIETNERAIHHGINKNRSNYSIFYYQKGDRRTIASFSPISEYHIEDLRISRDRIDHRGNGKRREVAGSPSPSPQIAQDVASPRVSLRKGENCKAEQRGSSTSPCGEGSQPQENLARYHARSRSRISPVHAEDPGVRGCAWRRR